MRVGPSAAAARRRRRLRAGALILLALAVLTPPAWYVYQHRFSPIARAMRLRAAARIEVRLGRPEAAAGLLRQAAALDPRSAEVRSELAAVLLRAGDGAAARCTLEEACEADPDVIEPRIQLALLALEARDFAAARRHIEWLAAPAREARVRGFGEVVALLESRLLYALGDPTAAARPADAALQRSPRSRELLLWRAQVALACGDAGLARFLLLRAAETGEIGVHARLLLSRACELVGDLAGARAALDRGAEGPEGALLLVRAAELAASRGDAEAVRAIRGSLPASAPASARDYIAGLDAAARGDLVAAESAFRSALASDPRSVVARLELAKALAARGELAAARTEVEAVLRADPLWRPARLQLVRLLVLAGENGRAAEVAEELLRDGPRDHDAARLLVAARAKEGAAKKAVRFFTELEAREPGNEAAAFGRNLAWLADLDADAAMEGSERLLAESPTARGAFEVLAAACAAKRGLAEALDRLRELVASEPRFRALRLQIAGIYAALGRPDIAGAELRKMAEEAPSYGAPRLALASLAEARGDLDGALAECERYRAIAGDDPAGRSLLARTLLAKGDIARALELSEQPFWQAMGGRALVHALSLARTGLAAAVEAGSFERAAARFEAARRLNPGMRSGMLAAAAVALGRDADATTWAEAAPAADSAWIGAVVALSRGDAAEAARLARGAHPTESLARGLVLIDALILSGDREGASVAATALGARLRERAASPIERALREYIVGASPRAVSATAVPLHRMLLGASYGFRRPVRALALEVLRAPERTTLAILVAARALDEAGAPDDALRAFADAAGRSPRSVPALEAYGAALVARGRYAEAALALERAVALAPDEPRIRVFFGLAREHLGHRDAAEEAYREAIRLDPASAVARTHLAWLLLDRGEAVDEALDHALRARAVDPSDARALEAVGFAHLLRERTAEALAALARARDAAPREARIRYRLGLAYRRLGDEARALAELEAAALLGGDDRFARAAAEVAEKIRSAITRPGRPGATPETAGRLPPGAEASDALGPTGTRHYFRTELAAGGPTEVRFAAPRDATPRLALLRAAAAGESALRPAKEAIVPAASELVWDLELAAGAYVIEVGPAQQPSLGTYRLAVKAGAPRAAGREREPNDLIADAQELAAGERVRGRLGPLRDRDHFLLPRGAGPLDVRIRATAPLRARLVRLDPRGALPRKTIQVPATATVEVPFVLSDAGLALEISPGEGADGEADYEVEARPAVPVPAGAPDRVAEPDDYAPATETIPGARGLAGTLSPPGDRDVLRLPAAPCAVTVRAPTDLGVAVEILGAGPAGGEPRRIRTSALAPGGELRIPSIGGAEIQIALRADPSDGASVAPFAIAFAPADPAADPEPNDDIATAQTVTGTARGVIDAPEDRDFHRFGPPAPGEVFDVLVRAIDAPLSVSLFASARGGSPGAVRTGDVPPGGALEARAWAGGGGADAIEVASATAGARYEITIRARARRPGEEVEPNDDATGAMRVAAGEVVAGTLDVADERDIFLLTAAPGAPEVEVGLEVGEGAAPAAAVRFGAPQAAADEVALRPGPCARVRLDGKPAYVIVTRPAGMGRDAAMAYRLVVR